MAPARDVGSLHVVDRDSRDAVRCVEMRRRRRPGGFVIVNFSTRFDRVTMFSEPALALLGMLGHSARMPGAMLAAELPAALARLRSALQESGHVPSPRRCPSPSTGKGILRATLQSTLRRGAVPLISMIEAGDRQAGRT